MQSPQGAIPWASSPGFPSGSVIRIPSFVWQICHDGCNDKDVYQRDLKKEEPAEAHELVVPETRQRPADPHEHKDQGRDFYKKNRDIDETENPAMRSIRDARKMPAAKKQSHDDS